MGSHTMWSALGATRVGSGPRTIVLANGLGTSQDTWRHVVSALETRAQLVRFDYPGLVPTTEPTLDVVRHSSLYGYADDVIALLREAELADTLFVGHSVSGMIGLIAAAAAPECIARVVTIAASCSYLNHDDDGYFGGFTPASMNDILDVAARDFRSWAAGFAPLAVGPEGTAEGIAEFTNYLRRMRPDIGLRTLRTIMLGDYRTVPSRVMQPVTVLQPEHDIVVPMSAAEYLAAHLPHGTLITLRSRGHVPMLTSPDVVIAQLQHALDTWPPV